MLITEEDYLAHYGTPRRSGRYPWGSGGEQKKRYPWGAGETQTKRNKMFLDIVEEHRKNDGMSDPDIARAYGISTTDFRKLYLIARNEQKQTRISQAQKLRDKGVSFPKIAEIMGLPGESSARALCAPGAKDKADILQATADMLRREVEKKGAIDVGTDVYRHIALNDNPSARLGISATKFDTAVAALREEGYKMHYVPVPQAGTGHDTNTKVLAKPDVVWQDLVKNPALIKPVTEFSGDHGRNWNDGDFQPALSISSKRVKVVYGNEGGDKLDGVIYVRPGVKDLSLGGKNYGQVRIDIDGTHYLKGMAVIKDDLPPGPDLVFHTNKSNTGNKLDAMKVQENDPDLPFGAVISKQFLDENHKVTSAMNLVNEEGKWDTWSKTLSTQFLSKQSPELAKRQLDMAYDRRRKEFEEISTLTNPAVRKKLLTTFADETDSAAVDLKAYHMPNQSTKVILPIKSIKEGEVFCPSLADGTRVALVRYPHGGTFEIPEVTVNNKNREARKIIGTNAADAIGIHHEVAKRLSGADFDGDTVIVIPNNRREVKSTPALEGLKDFDPKRAYPGYDGMRTIDGGTYNATTNKAEFAEGQKKNPTRMQHEMGSISNLITDMTLKGANEDEVARAVRHSMVIIDAEKHSLDFKSSERENAIKALKLRYQPRVDKRGRTVPGGASTLISRRKSPITVDKRKPRPAAEGGPIDRATGKKVFVPDTYTTKDGEVKTKKTSMRKLEYHDNAYTLVSTPNGTLIEHIYADHSNRLKALGNDARKEYISTQNRPMSKSAQKVYAPEVASMTTKLSEARKNAPRERLAQRIAKSNVAQKKAANPWMDKADEKKIESQALAKARVRCGARKNPVVLTDREWLAIQSGAISNHMLEMILDNGDLKQIRELATPRPRNLMSPSNTARAKIMLERGATQAEVADQLGVSVSTLKTSLKDGA